MAKVCFITLYDKGCLGARYLSSALRRQGHTSSIVYLEKHEGKLKDRRDSWTSDEDLWIGVNEYGRDIIRSFSDPVSEKDTEILLELLGRLNPDIVAFSLRSMFLDTAVELTRRIRSRFELPVIFGGIAATCEPERCIQHADLICIGEGEQAMLEVAARIDTGSSFENINNVWSRHEGNVCRNSLYPLQQNLDSLSFPDYDSENKYWIADSRLVEQDTAIGNMSSYTYEIMTSRGCPFSCSYCCNDLFKRLYHGQRYLRRRSVQNVLSELKEAKDKFNLKSVLFRDEVFTYDWNWVREFVDGYKKEIRLPFWCNTHPLFVDAKILKLLKECGMYSITMGIQSGSKNVLYNVFNRKTPVEKIIQSAACLDQLNLPLRPRYDMITNNPFETEEDCRQTLELLMKLSRPVDFGLTKLSFIAGTQLARMPRGQAANEVPYEFWNNLYLLTQYRFFPNGLIRALSGSKLLRKYPQFLRLLLAGKFIQAEWQEFLGRVKRHLPRELILFFKKLRYKLRGY